MFLPQTITLPKIVDRFNKDKLFVTVDDFDIDRVIVGGSNRYHNATFNDNISYQKHHIFYIYRGDTKQGDTKSKTAIIEPLRLYCKNLKIRNVQLFITKNNTYIRHVKFPFDNDANVIDTKIHQIIHDIKLKIVQDININNNINKDSIDKMLNTKDLESISVSVGPTGDLTSNISLSGSNDSISTIKNLQSIIRSSKYKRVDSCDCVLMFSTTITEKIVDNGTKDESISFRGLIDVMEMFHDRSHYVSSYMSSCMSSSILEPRDKIVVFDNTLVL